MLLDTEFRWKVSEGPGYRWVDGEALDDDEAEDAFVDPPDDRRWLVDLLEIERTTARPFDFPREARRYRPLLDEPGLFREFAALPHPMDEASVQDFANRYGRLEDRPLYEVIVSVEDTQDAVLKPVSRPALVSGEPRSLWEREIGSMRRALELWRIIREGDRVAAGSSVRRIDPEVEPLVAAERQLRGLINGKLAVRSHLAMNGEPLGAGLALVARPRDLLSALWLQFADAVERDLVFRPCDACPRWYEVSPDARRREQRFCSGACRSRAFRERKSVALRLGAEGRPLPEIVARSGADERSIRRWLGEGG